MLLSLHQRFHETKLNSALLKKSQLDFQIFFCLSSHLPPHRRNFPLTLASQTEADSLELRSKASGHRAAGVRPKRVCDRKGALWAFISFTPKARPASVWIEGAGGARTTGPAHPRRVPSLQLLYGSVAPLDEPRAEERHAHPRDAPRRADSEAHSCLQTRRSVTFYAAGDIKTGRVKVKLVFQKLRVRLVCCFCYGSCN